MTQSTRSRVTGAVGVLLAAVVLSGTARAHVDYVTNGDGPQGSIRFLVDVFSNPLNLALAVGGLVGVTAVVVAYWRFDPFRTELDIFTSTLRSYKPYLPWMLRLSMGLPLVGAGFSGYLFTPSVPGEFRVVGVTIGFLLLFGFLSRAVATVGLLAYLAVLVVEWPTPLLAVEYVPGLLGIVVLGSGQPSFDGILRRLLMAEESRLHRFNGYHKLGQRTATALGLTGDKVGVILRVGVGVNFVYLGLTQKLMQPGMALAVVEKYSLTSVVPVSPEMWVAGAGLAEVAVGLALILGVFTRASAAVAFALFTLTLFGLPDDPVVAHVTLFGLSSAILVTGRGEWSPLAAVREFARSRAEGPDEPVEQEPKTRGD
jgi:uncharacterized membrane protein YphA (DoxX/SURF4 family)